MEVLRHCTVLQTSNLWLWLIHHCTTKNKQTLSYHNVYDVLPKFMDGWRQGLCLTFSTINSSFQVLILVIFTPCRSVPLLCRRGHCGTGSLTKGGRRPIRPANSLYCNLYRISNHQLLHLIYTFSRNWNLENFTQNVENFLLFFRQLITRHRKALGCILRCSMSD